MKRGKGHPATAGSQGTFPPAGRAQEPAEVYIPAKRGSRGASRSVTSIVAGVLLFLLFAGAVAGMAGVALLFYFSNIILPGVHVLDVNVGSLTREEAAVVLESQWQAQRIDLTSGDQTLTLTAAELGMNLDTAATVQAAYRQGRSVDSLFGVLSSGLRVAPVWTLDTAAAETALADLAPDVSVPAVDAGIEIIDGQVREVPPVNGEALDIAATRQHLTQNAAAVLAGGRLPLVMAVVAPAITDVSAQADEARQMLTHAVTVSAYDPIDDERTSWTLGPDVWSEWLQLSSAPGAVPPWQWMLDEASAAAYVDAQGPALGENRYLSSAELVPALRDAIVNRQPEVAARVYHSSRQHVVQSGETLSSIGRDYGIPYPWLQEANPNLSGLNAGDTITIPSPDVMLPLPVVENKRVRVSIAEQRVWVYENGAVKWEWPASTGIDTSPTAPGVFQVQSHEPNAYAGNWDLWMPSFMGIYRPVPTSEFMNGFHGFPTRNGSTLLWTGDLGHKVTYGCILLSSENAAALYDWAEPGVVVEIEQ